MTEWVFEGMRGLPVLWMACCALLGGMAASFAGVAAWRTREQLSLMMDGVVPDEEAHAAMGRTSLWARSRCEGCGRLLGFLDLLPVLGWLVRRGRCPACGHRVPATYPLVEFASAVLFVAIGWSHGPGWAAVSSMLMAALLVAAAWTDWENYCMFDSLLVPCMLAGLYIPCFEPSADLRLWGGAAAGGVIWLAMAAGSLWKGDSAMASGDVMLMFAGGALLGLDNVLPLLMLSGFTMVAYSLPMRIWGLGKPSTALHETVLDGADPRSVPMGPAIAAAIVALSFMPRLWTMPLSELLGVG